VPVAAPGHLPPAGPWLLFLPVPLLASLVGALAISRLALAADGEGGGAGAPAIPGRLLALFGAALLVMLGILLLALAAFLSVALAASTGAAPALAILPLLAAFLLLLWLWARLVLLTPVAAAEPLGPLGLIRRSWALTAGHSWSLLFMLATLILLSLVALLAARAAGGVVITLAVGPIRPGTAALVLALLVSAFIQAVVAGLFTAFVARVYARLAAATARD
jgi:hypothetical protein